MIESITKTVISHDTAAAIVADAFGEVGLDRHELLPEGGYNAVYELFLADGRRVALKIAPPPDVVVMRYERNLMSAELAAMRIATDLGQPVPAVLWHDTTATRVASELFIMEWCPGTAMKALRPHLSTAEQQHVDAQIAGFLRTLHSVTADGFGLFAAGSARFERWSDAFIDLYDMLLADAADLSIPLPRPYAELALIPRRHVEELDLVTRPSFVHWDMWDQNTFVDPTTLQVTGLIDYERAMWADPLMEVNFVLKGNDDAFMAAYGTPLLAEEAGRTRRALYDLYLSTVMTVESTYRRYTDPANESMGRMWLDATLPQLS
jgi:aminoglycoside phosphotransferase (APT) family kinase protein